MEDVVVSIQCLTFNHKDYLRQCLDGFISQQTNFKFEALIHDDASTDGTTEILREYAERYPNIIIPIIETENQWSKGNLRKIMDDMTSRSRGRYIAYCEGDDYWQDPLKLQKQVDALENHPEASMCYTAFQTVDVKSKPVLVPGYESIINKSHGGEIFFDMLKDNLVLTVTVLFRKSNYDSAIYKKNPISLDYFNYLVSASLGKSFYIPERTACYRQTQTGAMSTQLPWVVDTFNKIREYFLYEYAIGNIPKPFSWAGFLAKVEMVNIALRRKMSGDLSLFDNLSQSMNQFILYSLFAKFQIKVQNIKYRFFI